MQRDVVEEAKEYVQDVMDDECSGHGWHHVKRVWNTAVFLADEEGADRFVVELAALLHDVDDYKVSNGDGLDMTRSHLRSCDLEEGTIERVCTVIEEVSFRGGVDDSVSSVASAVVQDADRLDAIGAIGIARTFAYGGEQGNRLHDTDQDPQSYETEEEYKNAETTTINHFYEKLLRLKDKMKTDTAKEIAQDRHAFMEQFLDRFFTEWDGKDLEEHTG